MAYTTREELEKRFGASELSELLDHQNDPEAAMRATSADADAVIDGYLGARYDLPLGLPVPALIVGLAADVTRYRLWDDRAPKEVRQRYEDAIAMLKDIAKGLVQLPVTLDQPAGVLGIVATTTRTRSFTDETLSGFVGGYELSPFGGGRGK